MANWGQSNKEWNDPEANMLPEKVEKLEKNGEIPHDTKRKRLVVVGLGMVGISFMWVSISSIGGIETDDRQRESA